MAKRIHVVVSDEAGRRLALAAARAGKSQSQIIQRLILDSDDVPDAAVVLHELRQVERLPVGAATASSTERIEEMLKRLGEQISRLGSMLVPQGQQGAGSAIQQRPHPAEGTHMRRPAGQ